MTQATTQYKSLEEYDQSVWQTQRIADNEKQILIFLQNHPEYALQCNIPLLRNFVEAGKDRMIDQEMLARAVEALGDSLARKAPEVVEKEAFDSALAERRDLLGELINSGASIELLSKTQHVSLSDGQKWIYEHRKEIGKQWQFMSPLEGRNALLHDADALVQFQAKMPIEELRQKVADLRKYRGLENVDHDALVTAARSEQSEHHSKPELVGGYPQLPDNFPRISLLSSEQIREAAKKYGWSQLNSRQRDK
jgi:hypothetical protein